MLLLGEGWHRGLCQWLDRITGTLDLMLGHLALQVAALEAEDGAVVGLGARVMAALGRVDDSAMHTIHVEYFPLQHFLLVLELAVGSFSRITALLFLLLELGEVCHQVLLALLGVSRRCLVLG